MVDGQGGSVITAKRRHRWNKTLSVFISARYGIVESSFGRSSSQVPQLSRAMFGLA